MEFPSEIKTPVKRRRRHSPQFKAQVLAEAQQPGASMAAVAQRHNFNANLVQKWRRAAERRGTSGLTPPAFIALPAPAAVDRVTAPEARIELPGLLGPIRVFWPCDQSRSLAEFIKHLS